jgi:hypothetical protein
MSKTKRVYIKTISAVIVLYLLFTHNLPSEKALASPTSGNDTRALENATAALINATKALQHAAQQLAPNNTKDVSDNSTISIEISRDKYAIGQPIEIFGNLTSANGTMANSPIKIIISPTSAEAQTVVNNITFNSVNNTSSYVGRKPQTNQSIPSSESEPLVNMTLNVINGSYSYRGLIPLKEAGIYKVNATTTDNNNTALAFIEIVDLFSTYSFRSIISTLFFFFVLIGTTFWYGWRRSEKPSHDPSIRRFYGWITGVFKQKEADKVVEDPSDDKFFYKAEIGRFIALTGISISLILSFIFIDVEVNPNGPMGLVNINSNGELNNNAAFTEWAINMGGSRNDNSESGLIIPVYVIALGLVGGFMRYLHKAYAKTEIGYLDKEAKRKKDEATRSGFVQYSLGELSDILIAPILAIAVWFIVSEEIQSVFLLAALSLTIGLATPNIISGLKGFASRSSGSPTSGSSAS